MRHTIKNVFILSVTCIFLQFKTVAQQNLLTVSNTETNASFPLASKKNTVVFNYDPSDAVVVKIAAAAFINDVKLTTSKQIILSVESKIKGDYAIVAGTIGRSAVIDSLIKNKQINISAIKNGWEQFTITVINNGSSSTKKLLVIAGSDRRGTAFGIFHLSRLIGVSPFVWWADVAPKKQDQLFISGAYTSTSTTVKYRGIFINDEDWGMQPWAAKKIDTLIKDIGPDTYAKIFELLLRLKANYIWPAMHPCTKAFYFYKQNPKVADDYAIVVGGSHCEPMLRNNVFEWAENYEHEYGKKPGEWRYDVNKNEIFNYWNDRIKEAKNYEAVYTVGMRGVHDGSMPGPKDAGEKMKLLQTVIEDQRTILNTNFNQPAAAIPQIFVPYKEVLSLYRRGLKLADDITIIWPDDNHGYIRQLPNAAERKRSGGHGVYYHLSYWGAPQDFLWLSSISPTLIASEMGKAYTQGASKLWVFNIGDIKPAELELQFAMDMAWDVNKWTSANAYNYTKFWAAEIFGDQLSTEIAAIKNEYYQLAASGKPEHLNNIDFTYAQMQERLQRYELLNKKVMAIKSAVPAALQDAFFQLVSYPVTCARLMNEKILYAKMQFSKASSNQFINKPRIAFDSIQVLTNIYNKQTANGKWDGMMSWHPRDQAVFKMPVLFENVSDQKRDSLSNVYFKIPIANLLINAADAIAFKESNALSLQIIKGIGISQKAVVSQLKNTNVTDTSSAYIEFDVQLPAGNYNVVVKGLPTFDVVNSKFLRYSVGVNNTSSNTINLHTEVDSKAWKENVIRGYSVGTSSHTFKEKNNRIRLSIFDAGLVINTIEFYKQ